MCQIRHQSPKGAIPTGLYSSNSCVAFGRLTISPCSQKAAQGSKQYIYMGELKLLPNWTVCRVKFCFHAAEGYAQEEIFFKSSKSIFLFSQNANSLFWSYFLQLLSRIGNPKSQSISSTRVFNSAVLSSAQQIENMLPHSLMLCFPQAHTCTWLLLYMYVQCSSIAVHYRYIGSNGI